MDAVVLQARAALRARARPALAVVVLLGLCGAVALASIAGGRRGRDALDRFLDHHRAPTVAVYADPELPNAEQVRALAALADVPLTVPAATSAAVIVAIPGTPDRIVAEAVIEGPLLVEFERTIVVAGDLDLADGEVAVNESFAGRRDVGVGDAVDLAVFDPRDLEVIGNGGAPAPKAVVTARIGAIVRRPKDLARSPQSQPGTVFEADESTMVLPPWFWAELGPDVATYGMGLLAAAPPDRVEEVVAALEAAADERVVVVPGEAEDLQVLSPVGDAIDLESYALSAFGVLVVLAGLVLLGPALARTAADDEVDRVALTAVGMTAWQRWGSQALRAAALSVPATVLAVVLAVPLSALTPVGLARRAEIDPGVEVDVLVLSIGGVGFLAALLARAGVGLLGERRVRAPRRPGRAMARIGDLGAPVPTALGTQLALDAATGRTRSAPRPAIVVAVAGVVAVVGAATFAASLDRLVGSPSLQGWTWDVTVGNFSSPETVATATAALSASPDVEAFAGYDWADVLLDGVRVNIAGVSDELETLLPPVLEGRFPAAGDELALGRGTLAQLGKDIGDEVVFTALEGGETRLRIVGAVVAPAVLAFPMDLDSGGVMRFGDLAAALGPCCGGSPTSMLVLFRDGVDRDAALDRLRADFPGTVLGPMTPQDVRDLGRVRRLPYLLAGLLGVMALASVALMLATVARRRRRDLAVLRGIGFDRRQVRSLVVTQSAVFTGLALVAGVPLGVAAGRLAWRLAADGLGTEVGPLVPVARILLAAVALVLLVAAVARVVGSSVARLRPAAVLRAE